MMSAAQEDGFFLNEKVVGYKQNRAPRVLSKQIYSILSSRLSSWCNHVVYCDGVRTIDTRILLAANRDLFTTHPKQSEL